MAAELTSAEAVDVGIGAEQSAVRGLIAKADPFVSAAQGRFVLDMPVAAGTLTSAEIAQVEEMIAATNEILASVEADAALTIAPLGAKAFVAAEDISAPRQARMAFREGVTKIEAQWFGFRVWLSKETVRAIGGGVGIGSLWIPEPLVTKILGSLGGAIAAFTPGEVVFNWSPVFTPMAPFGTFWGQEWQ
ncbi:hypothetical protein [Microbacterium sp. S308A+]